jgi:hypothetical protein
MSARDAMAALVASSESGSRRHETRGDLRVRAHAATDESRWAPRSERVRPGAAATVAIDQEN